MDNGESSYRRFLAGDESAFDEILKCYRLRLIFFIDRIVKDTAAAEDIAIDVFTYILMHKNRYKEENRLSTYLFMLARSRAIDYLRHKNRRRELPLSSAIEVSDDTDPYYELLKSARRRVINEAIATLNEEMQQVVHLVYFEGFTYKIAAKIMKKSEKQVDNLLYRAKALLRDRLKREVDWLL